MGNDIEIRVRVTNQTQSGINAVNTALRTLTTRATAAATALNRLEQQAEDATRALRRLARQADDTAHAMSGLSTSVGGASNSLRTFNTRAGSAATRLGDLDDPVRTLRRDMDDLSGSIDGVNGGLGDLRGGLGRLTVAGNNASSAFGGGGGGSGGLGLKGSLIGIGAVLGTSVLPSIGALSPMLFGLAGVGGAAALAMDDLKKEFKKLKPEFEDLQKVASKAVMPGVKKSMNDWRGALKGLNPVVKEGGKAFGEFVENAADFANSPAFKSSLLKNVEMGSKFFGDFTDSLFDFTQAFLDFGTKSQPTLDAFQNLFGGLLDRGLPDMFKEMEQGIGGSADVIDGLAYLINDALLPSLGKIAGSFSDSFGPLLGEMLVTAGNQIKFLATAFDVVAEALEPVANLIADAFRAWNEFAPIAASVAGTFAKEVGGALLESLLAVAGVDISELDDGFRGLSDWVKDNQAQIRGGLLGVAEAITTMVQVGIESLPKLFGVFRFMAEGILTGIDTLVSTLAGTFGNLPGIGEVFKDWNESFDEMAGGFREDLDNVGEGIDSLVDETIPRLSRAKLTMNVDQAEASLEHIKAQLEDPKLTDERKAKLTADKKDAEEKLAAAKRDLAKFDKAEAKAKLDADSGPFASALSWVRKQTIPKKTGMIVANTGGFWGSVRGLVGKTLGTSYVNVQYRKVDSSASPTFKAMGGPIRRLAGGGSPDGGRVVGPGTETSDSIPAMLSAGEYVVRASSVRKYGERFLNDLNEGRLKVPGFAGGGRVRSEARQARGPIRDATSGDTESSLLRLMDTIVKGHMKMATALTKVNGALDKARDKLTDLRNSASNLAGSVKSGVLSDANITRGASGDKPVTVRSIMGGLTASRDKATAFAGALKQLRSRGLSKDLLRQIAEGGVEGGGLETAGALLRASGSELNSINSLQSQISGAAGSAGKTTADALYASQIKSQEKLVKALDELADELKKASKKSKKSSGRKSSGGVVGAAASGGVRSGLTWVGEYEPELLDLPVGSRVRSGPDSRRIAASAAATGQPIIVHQTIELDGRVLAQQMFDPLRGVIHRRGGLKALER
ncbi:hypothetical protein PV755_45440 [Streptomyces caniscabiei]|uniref:Uncharacterized protein n=1 Tax=Streptomyces caniscabiei TaxID=2746961 RepID=A0A927L1W0_9ACTN|nr:cell envelope integrity protein TolA [Streptomyces caniscabiei]MBD9723441.1 hypothetical protein [Streptomyces caniscabiei]MDX3516061.1 hypothetical protein [Streptomyces caniscabiei]MDX3725133.1 hypothetical protein [Streptomyces caniscabiei]